MKKTVAIIPVKGREPLLYFTVKRLVDNGLIAVCVGHTMSEKLVCEMAGAEFVQIPDRHTLGHKWQLALLRARKYEPDSVLYMGSSDWVSSNWCEVLQQDLDNGYAMSGTKGIYFLDIQPKNEKKLIWWGGYLPKRSNEPIGTGRLFSRKALDMMNWRIFDVRRNSSMDYSQTLALHNIRHKWAKDKLVCFNDSKEIASLSISTYRWSNKHSFENEAKYPTAKPIQTPDNILSKYFKEVINLFNE